MTYSLSDLQQALANLEKTYLGKQHDQEYFNTKKKLEKEIALFLKPHSSKTGAVHHSSSKQKNKHTAQVEGKAWAYNPFKNMPVDNQELQSRTRFLFQIESITALFNVIFCFFGALIYATFMIILLAVFAYFALWVVGLLTDSTINLESIKNANRSGDSPFLLTLGIAILFLYCCYCFLKPQINNFREMLGLLQLSNTKKAQSIILQCFDNSHLALLIQQKRLLSYRHLLRSRQSKVFNTFKIKVIPGFSPHNAYPSYSVDDIFMGVLNLFYHNRENLQVGFFLQEKGQDPATLYVINKVIRAGNAEHGIHISGCKIIAEGFSSAVHVTVNPFFASSGYDLNSNPIERDEVHSIIKQQERNMAKANLDESAKNFAQIVWKDIEVNTPWRK